jgi:hypothetical protein
MKKILGLLVITIVFIQTPEVMGQEYLSFSDTQHKFKEWVNHHGEWIILTKKNHAFYYGQSHAGISSLDDYLWDMPLSADFTGPIWFDRDHIFFKFKDRLMQVHKKNAAEMTTYKISDIEGSPHFNGTHLFYVGTIKGQRGQICYIPKKKKAAWIFPLEPTYTPTIYTSDFMICRDPSGLPLTIDYEKGKPVYPAKYQNDNPFSSWLELYTSFGNDPYDSLFFRDDKIYAFNRYFGYLRMYHPNLYPETAVTVDMNGFTKKNSDFNYTYGKYGHMFHTHQGFQLVTHLELDSLSRFTRPAHLSPHLPLNPISKPQYYKVKSTTKMGEFSDFGRSQFLGALGHDYLVFEDEGQMIGVSPYNGRTYNFPQTPSAITHFTLHENTLFFTVEHIPALIKMEVDRVMSDEELKQLEPPKEYFEMLEKMQKEQENTMRQSGQTLNQN